MRSRNTDGSLAAFSSRRPPRGGQSTYLAEKGAIIKNPLGLFLIMSNGTIQQRSKIDRPFR